MMALRVVRSRSFEVFVSMAPSLGVGVLVFISLVVCTFVVPPLAAQDTGSTASLNGIVRDISGAVMPDTAIKLTSISTSVSRLAHTNKTGGYAFVSIIPGSYTLEASKEGFKTERRTEFLLQVNQTATVDFILQVGSRNQVVNVSGEAIQLETSTSELGDVVGTREVQDLPLNGRNFTELLVLMAGASSANPLQNAG